MSTAPSPNGLDPLLSRAHELLRSGDTDSAVKVLQHALELAPSDPRARSMMGLVHVRVGKLEAARDLYRELTLEYPADPIVRLNLGLVLLKLGDIRAADRELAETLRLDPKNDRARQYLGLARRLPSQPPATEAAAAGGAETQTESAPAPAPPASSAAPSAPYPPAVSGRHTSRPASVRTTAEPEGGGAPASSARRGGGIHPPFLGESPGPRPAVVVAIAAESSGLTALTPPPTAVGFATSRLLPQPAESRGGPGIGLLPSGLLCISVRHEIYMRREGIVTASEALAWDEARRRTRGMVAASEPFAAVGRPMYIVRGLGQIVASARGGRFYTLALDSDILYVCEDALFAFESTLAWENGRAPGGEPPLVQLRGTGSVALRLPHDPFSIKVDPAQSLVIDAAALLGWIGRVVPRPVPDAAAGGPARMRMLECSGEGVLLCHDPDKAGGVGFAARSA